MRFGRLQRCKTGVVVTRVVSLTLFMAVLFRHALFHHALFRHVQFLLSPVLARLMARAPGYTALPHCNEALSRRPRYAR